MRRQSLLFLLSLPALIYETFFIIVAQELKENEKNHCCQ